MATHRHFNVNSELAEPHKLLSYLLQPRIMTLPTEIIAVYLHAAMKVFGSWAAELADRWDDDDLPKVRGVVDDVLERLSSFVTSPDIEVQERVSASPVLGVLVNLVRSSYLAPTGWPRRTGSRATPTVYFRSGRPLNLQAAGAQ